MRFRAESLTTRTSNITDTGLFSVALDVRLIGPLWAPGIFDKAIEKAQKRTTRYGKRLIQSRTPVDTGNLRSKWYTTQTDIINDEYYAGFVEYGTIFFDGYFMAKDSTNEIEDYYLEQLKKQISKDVGGFFKR